MGQSVPILAADDGGVRRLGHGQWLPWLRANCGVGDRQAAKYMKLAKEMPELLDSNSNRSANLISMNTAFALITADDDTKAVVQAKFDAGESVTVREIEELKRQAAAAKRLAMNNSKSSQTLSEWLDRFTLSAEETARRERAALRLKERLSLVPFYANRAAEYRAEGGDEAEMAYWRRLHGSAMLSD